MKTPNNYCVFCGKPATTREHVFSKCFFDKPYPQKMLTVSSCNKCNQSFSLDEQYLMYLIDYLKSIETGEGEFTREKVANTFAHGDSLEQRMMESLAISENAVFFQIEEDRVANVVNKTAQCLFRHQTIEVPSTKLECKWAFLPQLCILRSRAATDAVTSGHPAELNGHPYDAPFNWIITI